MAAQQIEFRGDGVVVAVVMADHDGVDHLAKSRSGARRANRAFQLLVGKAAHQICARLSALAEQVDHLGPWQARDHQPDDQTGLLQTGTA